MLFIVFNGFSQSGPPKPPLGKRWVLNPDFSDEFNGTALDTTKWYNYHPNWKGRVPGLFMPSQVSVKDGFLQIKGEKMERDTLIHAYNKDLVFNIKGGAVVSKKAAFLGYYECRVKAAATTMSTTFWFSTNNQSKAPNGCGRYGLEWDIHESIGRTGGFKGDYFASGMHSNSHYWYTDCNGVKHDYRAPQVKFEDAEVTSKDFHVYGGWWRNESTASYYYDDRAPKHQKFYDSISAKPFNKPMYMRLVSETYPFPWIELPNDEELADSTKNTVYYDWVRGYSLVDVTDAGSSQNLEAQINLYDENIAFPKPILALNKSENITIPLTYKTNTNRKINLKVFNSKEEKVAEKTIVAYAGYANLEANITIDEVLLTSDYKLKAILQTLEGDNTTALDLSFMVLRFN